MEMSDQIIKVLDEVCKRFGLVIDWSKDNVLPYVQELAHKIIMYDMVKTITVLVFSVIGLVAVGIFLRILFKEYITYKTLEGEELYKKTFFFIDKSWGDLNGFGLTFVIAGGVIGILSIIYLFTGTGHLIQNLTFPELTVIEFIKPFLN